MKKLRDWVASIPHLFGKVMVIWCVACGSASCFYALRVLSRTDKDPTGLLGVILAFFGGELALMFGREALKKKDGKDEEL